MLPCRVINCEEIGIEIMDYAVHPMPSYQNLQGTPQRAHLGSQSQGHYAGGDAGWGIVGSGKPTVLESGAPKGMEM
jgi:hypothetical protein